MSIGVEPFFLEAYQKGLLEEAAEILIDELHDDLRGFLDDKCEPSDILQYLP